MTATPRDLDPKFNKATIPTNPNEETVTDTEDATDATDEPTVVSPRTVNGIVDTSIPAESDNEFTQISYVQRYTDNEGVAREKVHGPMPVNEWPAYEKEHNL